MGQGSDSLCLFSMDHPTNILHIRHLGGPHISLLTTYSHHPQAINVKIQSNGQSSTPIIDWMPSEAVDHSPIVKKKKKIYFHFLTDSDSKWNPSSTFLLRNGTHMKIHVATPPPATWKEHGVCPHTSHLHSRVSLARLVKWPQQTLCGAIACMGQISPQKTPPNQHQNTCPQLHHHFCFLFI